MIYAIADDKYIKIGFSENPQKRLNQLQTAQPVKLRLLKVWQGEKWMEGRIHLILKPLRTRHKGEWFRLIENDLSLIDEILSKC